LNESRPGPSDQSPATPLPISTGSRDWVCSSTFRTLKPEHIFAAGNFGGACSAWHHERTRERVLCVIHQFDASLVPPLWRTRTPQHAALFPPYDECPSESCQGVSEAHKATRCSIPCWIASLPLHRASDDAFQARAV